MHIKYLKVFCDVVERRSFSKAADDNGLSQSSASQMVHHLEDRIGVLLIDRSKRPFELTPEGQRYFDGCRDIVRRYFDLEHEVQTLHEAVAARLRLASIYSVGLAHMSQYLREFLAAHPKADVRVEYLHPDRVYQVVESDEADLGLVSYPERSRELATIPWREERMAIVCAPDHPLAANGSARLESLSNEDFIGFQRGLQIREHIDRVLAERGVSVEVTLEFDNIETIKRAIEIGAGVSILPEPTVTREVATGDLRTVAIEGERIVRPIGLIRRRDRELNETAKKFVELLQSHADETQEPADPQSRRGHAITA